MLSKVVCLCLKLSCMSLLKSLAASAEPYWPTLCFRSHTFHCPATCGVDHLNLVARSRPPSAFYVSFGDALVRDLTWSRLPSAATSQQHIDLPRPPPSQIA